MRILKLRFENLNSLYGEWEVDFTHPAYTSSGIFAITGPTGSGKTTILDAICLALYGRTPRLERINQSSNEIMSRLTGKCYAEVTFETGEGKFRCHWSQHRARSNPRGRLQAPRHEIAGADTGEVLETKLREVPRVVERLTGMDFHRFSLSMMLAQGEFAAFLGADPDERAPILEQITGTDIYSRISMKVHERLRMERDRLNILELEAGNVRLMDPVEEERVLAELEALEGEEAGFSEEIRGLKDAIRRIAGLESLRKEIRGLEESRGKALKELEEFAPEMERLGRARAATSLEGMYGELKTLRAGLAETVEKLDELERNLPALREKERKAAEHLDSAGKRLEEVRRKRESTLRLLRDVRLLDGDLAALESGIRRGGEKLSGISGNIGKLRREKKNLLLERDTLVKRLEKAGEYLERHREDRWLIGGYTGLEEQFRSLQSLRRRLITKEYELEAAGKEVERLTGNVESLSGEFSTLEEMTGALHERLERLVEERNSLLAGRLLREYRAERDALLREKALVARVAELEEYRAGLEEGKPCPLCGSTVHPYVDDGKVPVFDEADLRLRELDELMDRVGKLDERIEEFKEKIASAGKRLADAGGRRDRAVLLLGTAEEAVRNIGKEVERYGRDVSSMESEILKRLRPLGVEEFSAESASPVLEALKNRRGKWLECSEEALRAEKEKSVVDGRLRELEGKLKILEEDLRVGREELRSLETEYYEKIDRRRGLFGEDDPDQEENRLEAEMSKAGDSAEKAAKELEKAGGNLRLAEAGIASLKKEVEKKRPDLRTREKEFACNLKGAGFRGEDDFLGSRMAPGKMRELSEKAAEMEDRLKELRVRLDDRRERLAVEESRRLTDGSVKELAAMLEEREKSLGILREKAADLRSLLKENRRKKKRLDEKKKELADREREYLKWKNLHDLIGSGDGKKFRNFAQGLTFEVMVRRANEQLRRMTDRYLLVLDGKNPLELNVVDNYQAGETRSTENLSGGESFVVSLALALGLAGMAGGNTGMDSLFLDEGFGTLDEDALDTALEALGEMHGEGKLIGVISHVTALKERIGARLEVIPGSWGRSIVRGPGCGRPGDRSAGE